MVITKTHQEKNKSAENQNPTARLKNRGYDGPTDLRLKIAERNRSETEAARHAAKPRKNV